MKEVNTAIDISLGLHNIRIINPSFQGVNLISKIIANDRHRFAITCNNHLIVELIKFANFEFYYSGWIPLHKMSMRSFRVS